MYGLGVGWSCTCFLRAQCRLSRQVIVGTSVRELNQYTKSSLNNEARLRTIKKGERLVLVLAGVSVIVGCIALKYAVSSMASGSPKIKQLVVAGPSGTGKSTLLKKLFEEFPDEFGFSVSHTTRSPRPGEKNGREYYFTTRKKMEDGIKYGTFIEHAEYSGNLYGTSKKSVSDVYSQGKICVLDIDMQGVRSIKATDLAPVYVLIKPPSMEELEKRLRTRKTDSDESIQRRLVVAREELEYGSKDGVFDHVIINENIDEAYQQLKSAVIEHVEALRKTKKKK